MTDEEYRMRLAHYNDLAREERVKAIAAENKVREIGSILEHLYILVSDHPALDQSTIAAVESAIDQHRGKP